MWQPHMGVTFDCGQDCSSVSNLFSSDCASVCSRCKGLISPAIYQLCNSEGTKWMQQNFPQMTHNSFFSTYWTRKTQKDYFLLVLRVRGRWTPGRGSWFDRTMLEALLQVEQGSLWDWKNGSLPVHNKHILKSFDTWFFWKIWMSTNRNRL